MKSKALLLLFIFLLNSVIGLSCALHMGNLSLATRADHGKDLHTMHHSHMEMGPAIGKSEDKTVFAAKEDPCCQGMANNFASLSKIVPQQAKSVIQIPVMTANFYYIFKLLPLSDISLSFNNNFIPRKRPPTADIRVTLQSFQI
ncbi:MAG: hypothetical protein V4520_11760 [Bacteroidota bacterium]